MLTQGRTNSHLALWLENDLLRVGVLPEKGADIFEFTYLPSGVQFLMRTPWGLKAPSGEPVTDFLENYEGGWQELFPSANDACQYRGREIPFHGEVALLPWQFQVTQDDEQETAIHLAVACLRTPFRLERTLRLCCGESSLRVQEKVTNISDEPFEFVWGHHLTLGGDFLEDGCRLDCPAARLFTPAQLFEPQTARLAAAQDEPWPLALGRSGERIDLRDIPGPQAHAHDDVILGGLERGRYSVTNPRLELQFCLEWDAGVFPWLMFWQPYGGADRPPLTGTYGVGLEPWTAPSPLAQAAAAGQARRLAGGESLQTEMVASVQKVGAAPKPAV
jgi:galactose mutarotase-like enzyme